MWVKEKTGPYVFKNYSSYVRISISIKLFSLNNSLNVKWSFCVDLLIHTQTWKDTWAGHTMSHRSNQFSHVQDHGCNNKALKPEGAFFRCSGSASSEVMAKFWNVLTLILSIYWNYCLYQKWALKSCMNAKSVIILEILVRVKINFETSHQLVSNTSASEC